MGKKSKNKTKISKNSLPKEAFSVKAVLNPDDGVGFVYSCGNADGIAEFIALDVPRARIGKVGTTMMYLQNRSVNHGDSVNCNECYVLFDRRTLQD